MAAVLSLLATKAALAQCHYTWTQIPVPPGWLAVFPLAINSNGHVVGHLYNQGDNIRSFLWTPETGTSVLPMPPGVFDLQANDMNDDEVIVGTMFGGANRVRAFVRRDGEYSFIEYPDWANNCVPYSISNRGQVAGMVQNNGPGPTHAFVWEDGVFHDLGPLIGSHPSRVTAINNQGIMTGYAQPDDNPPNETNAFLTDGESVNWLPEPEDFPVSWGQELNDNGITVGRVVTGTDVSDPNWRYVGG
ncbi:MAG: hypothetical protein HZB38_03960, partial [Planctomycetes bacterium]|nr:hypothetical protein [Planctomycetota bacterium]